MRARVLLGLSGSLLASTGAVAADDGFRDTSFGFRYGTDLTEPGVVDASGQGADIAKRIYNFTYVDGSRYGGNLLIADYSISDAADPNRNRDSGARELYVIYRHTFALSAWTGQNYGFGPVRNTDLVAGIDLNTKDSDYAPRKRMLVLGPKFEFALPAGFANLALLAEKEYDHNGIVGRTENFNTTWALESAWQVPFNVGALPARVEGYLDVYGPKGRNQFGEGTKTETLFHPRLMFDFSALADHANLFWAGIGYEYWQNKFGVDHAITPGAVQRAWLLETAVHW